MSVDYNAEYGIGYQVVAGEGISEEQLEEGLEEYLYDLTGGEFEVFTVGNAMTGDYEGTYLVRRKPFDHGVDLAWVKGLLDEEVARLGLEVEGDFGLVGGLYVY